MKSIVENTIKLGTLILVLVATMVSCEYQEYAPADYPEQLIYMPAAIQGIFWINELPSRRGDTPTPGQPYRFVVDNENGRLIVPLGIYRSGVTNDGGFVVDITVNNDTISQLINEEVLNNTELLPSAMYSVPTSVDMLDGKELAVFELSVNLDFLRDNYPDQMYAFGVTISSPERNSNPEINTTVVVIDTKIIKPTADFTATVGDNRTVVFQNTSIYATSYSWNFGDGSENSIEISPTHTYATPGNYSVTLSATGITGDIDKSTIIEDIEIP